MLTEAAILAVLIALFNQLGELVLRVLGLWRREPDQRVSVTVTALWQLEPWWLRQLPLTAERAGIGPEATATLQNALGDMITTLNTVVDTGGGPEEVRAAVLRFRDRWTGWARKVAITESTRAASEAVLSSPAAQRPGALKEWVTEHDTKVRTSHRLVDGMRIPLVASFQLLGGPMRFPGDPLGNPEEVVNCRCQIRIVPGGTR